MPGQRQPQRLPRTTATRGGEVHLVQDDRAGKLVGIGRRASARRGQVESGRAGHAQRGRLAPTTSRREEAAIRTERRGVARVRGQASRDDPRSPVNLSVPGRETGPAEKDRSPAQLRSWARRPFIFGRR